jgi:hypothetical protein
MRTIIEKDEAHLACLDGPAGECDLPLVMPWSWGVASRSDVRRLIERKIERAAKRAAGRASRSRPTRRDVPAPRPPRNRRAAARRKNDD